MSSSPEPRPAQEGRVESPSSITVTESDRDDTDEDSYHDPSSDDQPSPQQQLDESSTVDANTSEESEADSGSEYKPSEDDESDNSHNHQPSEARDSRDNSGNEASEGDEVDTDDEAVLVAQVEKDDRNLKSMTVYNRRSRSQVPSTITSKVKVDVNRPDFENDTDDERPVTPVASNTRTATASASASTHLHPHQIRPVSRQLISHPFDNNTVQAGMGMGMGIPRRSPLLSPSNISRGTQTESHNGPTKDLEAPEPPTLSIKYKDIRLTPDGPALGQQQQTFLNGLLARRTTWKFNLTARKDSTTIRFPQDITIMHDVTITPNGGEHGILDAKDTLLILYACGRDMEWELKLLQKFPDRIQVRWVDIRKDDGTFKKITEHDPNIFLGVTMLLTYSPVPADFLPKLRFVQLSSAGSDLWVNHPKYLDKKVVFCTTSGAQAPQIAEWVVGAWLKFQHHFELYQEYQEKRYWEPPLARAVEDSVGLRVGILGYGAIGRQVARVLRALGMEIYAFTSTERSSPQSRHDKAFSMPGLGDPYGEFPARWFHGTDKAAVNSFLKQNLDLLIISLPLTAETTKLISTEQFDILSAKRTFVVNIARGPILDQEALVEALEKGKIRGAALDVTDPEPLPQDHPLWKAKNCFITPHVSWQSTHQMRRVIDILAENVSRLLEGRALMNEIKR